MINTYFIARKWNSWWQRVECNTLKIHHNTLVYQQATHHKYNLGQNAYELLKDQKDQYNTSNRIASLLVYQFQSSFSHCKSKFNQTAVPCLEKHQSVLFLVSSCLG